MGEYKRYAKPLLKDVEGFETNPYPDQKGHSTIGVGMKLSDPDIRGIMQLRNIDPDQVERGEISLTEEQLDDINDAYLDKREPLVKSKLGPVYDTLPDNKKAAMMSMGYQSLNNLGPSLTGYLSSDDNIGAIKEMLLRTNKDKDPGTAVRRLKEAELFGGPLDFSSSFNAMSQEEKKHLLELIGGIKNENTKKEMLEKYSPYLQEAKPKLFNKINKMLSPKIEEAPIILKKP